MKSKSAAMWGTAWLKPLGRSLPWLGLALLPKCPMCVAAYAGILATCGIGLATVLEWSGRILLVAGGVVLWQLWQTARESGRMLPWWLGLGGFAALVGSRFWVDSDALQWTGLAVGGLGGGLAFWPTARRRTSGGRSPPATPPSRPDRGPSA
jgi:hypothetical protein